MFYNPYLLTPLLVWAITQFLKFIIAAARGQVDFRYLYASGGMPSVHSATVVSLATTAFLVDGANSSEFGITAILAAIVMYDSFGVRRSSGEQAAAINLILDSLDVDKVRLIHPHGRLRELLGHKPMEVTVGAVIGFVLAGLLNPSYLDGLWAFLKTPVSRTTILAVIGIGALLVVGSFIGRALYMRRYRKIEVVANAIRRIYWAAFLFGLVTLALGFLQYEKVAAALWVAWPITLAGIGLAILVWLIRTYRRTLPLAIADNQSEVEKQKWLPGPNKKRRAAKERSRKRR